MLEKLKSAVSSIGWWVAGPGVAGATFLGCWAIEKDFGSAFPALLGGGLVALAMSQLLPPAPKAEGEAKGGN